MRRARLIAFLLLGVAGLAGTGGRAEEPMIVEKKTFSLPSFTTQGGATIRDLKVGWESYGTLNPDRSNVVLVTHYFSGTSHAAGRYAAGDPQPGYWDAIIGPGKAIDTNRWFVISSDTLTNLSPGDPKVVTTGPASTDPATGKPYGTTFPVVSMRDFIEVQKALLESLGVRHLRAVVGASMGGLQAYEWAGAHPDMIDRIVPVISGAGGDAYLSAWLDVWGLPIRQDPKWRAGAYDPSDPPRDGLAQALKIVTLHAQGPGWATTTFGSAPADPAKPVGASIANPYKIGAALDAAGATRAKVADANNMLYLIRANQLTAVDPATIRVPTLLVYSPTDQVFRQEWVERTAAAIRGAGTLVETRTIEGPYGHLNGVLAIAPAGPVIREFLERDLGKR